MAKARRKAAKPKETQADSYEHPESTLLLRPDVGTQPQFKKKKPAQRYKYDSSLSPLLEWDGQNPAREEDEASIDAVAATKVHSGKLSAIGRRVFETIITRYVDTRVCQPLFGPHQL